MKPEGRKKVRFPEKRDVHPRKGMVNWWENRANTTSRKARKQEVSKDIERKIIKKD